MKKKILLKSLFSINFICLFGGCTNPIKKQPSITTESIETQLDNSIDKVTHYSKTQIPYKPFFKDSFNKNHPLPSTIKRIIKDKIAAQTSSEAPKTVYSRKLAQSAAHSANELETTLCDIFNTLGELKTKLNNEARDEDEKSILSARIEKLTLRIDQIKNSINTRAPVNEEMFGSLKKSTHKTYQRAVTRKVITLKAKVAGLVREIS